ncbi:MAG: mannitol dehydrogenase family protein [Gammaproteobacteria bacterium]|nr:mannitol dehydrogenase family protein [Gammaproteobacteria bacterium]
MISIATQASSTTYDRSACRVGMVHLGFGAFHRAHQAWYVDRMMDATGELNWAIAAVNLRAADSTSFARSQGADGRYILKTVAADGACQYRIMRPHLRFADWPQTPAKATRLLALKDVQVVTITITESGYHLRGGNELDRAATPIAAEIEGRASRTVYAYLRAGLKRRQAAASGALTIMCCDNLRKNGVLLRHALEQYLNACGDSALLDWMQANVSFPSSMVDRITPRPPADLARSSAKALGCVVRPAVLAEEYVQWVVEDNFKGAAPPLESAGVQIVPCVEPFEEAKIRILNGGHTALAYLGALAGHATFDQAMQNPELLAHFRRFQLAEVIPALGGGFPFSLTEYAQTVEQRFANPHIGDAIERICMDGVNKMRIFMLPTVVGTLHRGAQPVAAYRSIASWVHFARAVLGGHMAMDYVDPDFQPLAGLFAPGQEHKLATATALWGSVPAQYPSFIQGLVTAVTAFVFPNKNVLT